MGDGAFSNVYKAVERKTGRKVAVKVVRKYELNSSQVRIILFSSPCSLVPFGFRFLVHSPLAPPPVPWPGRDPGGEGLRQFLPSCSVRVLELGIQSHRNY
jgi:serine/threonine protein kinase